MNDPAVITKLREKIRQAIDGNGCAEMYFRWWQKKGFPTVEECEDWRANDYDYTSKDVDEAFAHFDDAALQKITIIYFKHPRLQKLPDSVRRLKNLETIHLSNTGISRLPGWLPELARLKELGVMDVWSKRGVKIADGIAPLLQMPQLQTLIWHDDWMGRLDVPKEIGKLTQLKKLAINGTTMKHLPKWLRGLCSLKSFSLSGGGVKKIPDWFCEMTSLERFWLSDTAIRVLPDNFGNLTALKEIYLYSNPIPELPESFGSLVNLERLVIYGMSIDYDRDLQKLPESIARLKALKELRLTGTNVQELPPALLKRERAGQLKIEFEYSKRGRKRK